MQPKLLIRSCKKKSIDTLRKNHLWLPLGLVLLLVELSFFGLALVFLAFERFLCIPDAYGLYALLFALVVSFFLLAPLWRGIQMLFLHELLFKRKETSLLFYCYSHRRRYAFSVRRSFFELIFLLFSVFLLGSFAYVGMQGTRYLLRTEGEVGALIALSLTAVLLFFVLLSYSLFRNRGFLLDAVFLSAPLLSYRQAKAISGRRIRGERETLRRFRLSFLPLWFISLLFLGFPLPILLPYYIGAKAHLAAALIQD